MGGYEEKNAGAVGTGAVGTDSGAGGTGNEAFAEEPMNGSFAQDPTSSGSADGGTGATGGADGSSADGERGGGSAGNAEGGQGAASGEGTEPEGTGRDPVNARMRRERKQAEAIEQARVDAIIEVFGGENPYSHTPLKDAHDVAVLMKQRAIEKNGGDPVTGYAAAMAEEQRETAERERAETERREWLANDMASFQTAYPHVSLGDIISDPDFAAFAEGKVGQRPIADIYGEYIRFVGKFSNAARERAEAEAAQRAANAQASVGSVNGRGEIPIMTREKLLKMSVSEVSKYKQENAAEYRRIMNGS